MKARFLLVFILSLALYSCKKERITIPVNNTDGKTGMLEAVNALRSRGCRCGMDSMPPVPLLSWNDTLALAANAHAQDMYLNNYFSHNSPDGTVPIQRAKAAGYNGKSIIENIAKGYYTLSDVIKAWENSEEHCKGMMNGDYTEMGAARANDYWVQEFGRP